MNQLDPRFAHDATRIDATSSPLDDQVGNDFDYHGSLDPVVSAAGPRVSGFGGFSWVRIGVTAAAVGGILWAGWMTSQLVELRRHRVVSVSIASMANDFIAAESRSGNSAEQTDADTRSYMLTLQKVLKDRAAAGETIIVSEAVVGASVPDITSSVREAVGKLMTVSPPPRALPRSASPALAPVVPPGAPQMQSTVPYAQVPQGGPPAGYVPQQLAPPMAQPPALGDGAPAEVGQPGELDGGPAQ